MQPLKSSHRVARFILIVGLILGFIGPMPIVSQVQPAVARPRSVGETPQSIDPVGGSNLIASTGTVTPTIPAEESGPIVIPQPIGPTVPPPPHVIHLKSRDFQPGAADARSLQQLARSDRDRLHVLVQLDFIPRDEAKAEYARRGVQLLMYVPDYAWIASVPAKDPSSVLSLPGVTWAGELTVNDKLDPMIQSNEWMSFNLAPDGTAAVYVITHLDEDVATTRSLIAQHGGKVTGEVQGIKMLIVEMPRDNIRALAAEEAVQWIAPAEPMLGEANDGIRAQIGVNTVQAAPYSLDGTGIDVLVYDSGQAGDHVDFGARLTHGDAATVREHSTHVAGTVGGSGANSINHGGTALQWRGMATNVDLISYAYQWIGPGMLFYNNPGDIEADWAAAQNTYGADLGTASLSSNIYSNYPLSCTLMGNYGTSEVLLDQIVRGGNAVVGVGDKYITTWAAGNERGNPPSCSTTYNTISPPAAAKNPIQVGASNTNDNSMTSFSSWGPTDDGRIKPIVVAGGCQNGGDAGVTSTDNSPVDDYTTMCGTSMATPAVAGSLALMLQHYRTVYNTSGNFWPSTAKAILMQTADDLGNPGPDYAWGFGQVDIQAAVDLISRRAFRQDNVAQGSTDVFYMIVPTSTTPLQVSLAWDDFEATFNANPTLINNLDLELEAPSGTIWRPWILNAASPASNATRGVNSVDNQEQATVPSPEIGTWIVRVKGTTVPQGSQDYSLACEGCKPLDVGVCQSKVSTAMASLPDTLSAESGTLSRPMRLALPEQITAGEQWQRSLEQPIVAQQPDDQSKSIEQARRQGDEAVVALRETLTGAARDQAMDDIVAAQKRLSDAAPPRPDTRPISEVEEQAALEARRTAEIANRAQALTLFDDPNEGAIAQGGSTNPPPATGFVNPVGAFADRTVGNGCTYATIAAAISASSPGDRLRIEGGRTFTENVTINKNLTLQGGYNGCASGSSALTTINGNASGSVIYINPGLSVTLQSLNLTNGNGGAMGGGGIMFAPLPGSGQLTLSSVYIYGNTSDYGGGLWIGPDTEVIGTNVQIYDNTAPGYGGGVRMRSGHLTLSDSNIYNNTAPIGGGVYATKESTYTLALDLPYWADVHDNHSTTGSGLGGGVYLREGTISLADCSDIYYNDAISGGGAYLVTSTLTINGTCSEIDSNTANATGGGVYAQGSYIFMQDQVELLYNTAGATSTADGGGAYLDNSNLYSDRSAIYYNTASDDGGGVYAVNSGVVMELGGYPCSGLRCSQLSYNTANGVGYGGGIYAYTGPVTLYNTFVENNTSYLGGGLYLLNAAAYVYNSLFARNNSTGSTGDGVRLNSGSLFGTNSTFAYNDAGGAATGRAFDQAGASSTSLDCSVVWGHASSFNATGQDVTYSDIQGGYGNSTNLNVDPLFVASGSQDYHLRSNSPVIDRCVSGSGPDFENELRPIMRITAASPYDMGADEVSGVDRVGVNGTCTYGTIQQAVNTANDGDTIRVAAGVYFENVDITAGKVITIEGGYNNTCTSTGAGTTRIEGSANYGSTIDILGGTSRLRNLQVAWGSGTGGGINVDGNSQVTLDNADVFNNHGDYGGGIWLNTGTAVTITNGSTVHDNTAMSPGGGVRTWGKFYGYGGSSEISWNCAPDGGGASVPNGLFYLDDASMAGNQAAGATGKGGAVYLELGGVVTLTNHVYLGDITPYGNTAYDGGAIYADDSTVNLDGSTTTLSNNTATHYGGGVYLTNGSALNMSGGGRIGSYWASETGNDAILGAGVYAITSTINLAGRLFNNVASSSGGGIYATASTVNLTGAMVGGTGVNEANQLGAAGHEGVGLYLTNNTQATLSNTIVASNTFQTTGWGYGGGMLVEAGSVVTLTNSRVERHFAPDALVGRGAGIYVRDASVTLDNSQVVSNTTAVGGGVRMWGSSTLNVRNGSSLINNQALTGGGGAIAAAINVGTPDINITNATLQYNTAATDGGAIYLDAGTLNFDGWWDVQSNHAAGNGGAIAVVGTGDAGFNVTGGAQQTYLATNRADVNGGALYVTNNAYVELYSTGGYPLNLKTNRADGNGGAAYASGGATFDFYGLVNANGNQAAGNGGVFYLSGGSRVWMDDYSNTRPQIWSNQAQNGGVVYAQAGSTITCDGTDVGTSVNGNDATAGSGGAFYLSGSTLTDNNCVFRDNQATLNGGAIAGYTSTLTIDTDYPSLSAPTLIEADRLNPTAPHATACNPLAQRCSNLYSNIADSDANNSGDGGAIYASASTLTVNYSYLHRNSGVRGGGIYQEGAGAVGQVNNTLVYSNTSTGNMGGGIRTEAGVFTMTHVTLANSANGAGYSISGGSGYARNSIAWGNANGGFWLASGVLTGTCNIDQSGNVGANMNPQFVAPGAGENYHLRLGSPAIDACPTGLPTDLDNRVRPLGGGFDMGAFEAYIRTLYLPILFR